MDEEVGLWKCGCRSKYVKVWMWVSRWRCGDRDVGEGVQKCESGSRNVEVGSGMGVIV